MEVKKCRCGGEAEVVAFHSGVYDRIHGYAKCKRCCRTVWGKVVIDTYDISTAAPDFDEWKRNAYKSVREAIVKAWNEEVAT